MSREVSRSPLFRKIMRFFVNPIKGSPFAAFFQKTLHLMRRFLWNDGFDLLRSPFGSGISDLLLGNRQPMSIGADQPQNRFLLRRDEGHQQTVENVARVIVSGRKEGFPNQLQEAGPGERNEPFPLNRRQRGIVGAGKTDDLKLALAGMNCRPVVVARCDFDFTDRQFLDDLIQLSAETVIPPGFSTVAL